MGRTVAGVLFALAMMLPVGLIALPAGANTGTYCSTSSGSETFSPPVPKVGDPTTVTPSVTATLTFGGCVGFGATSGTAVYTGKYSGAVNCTMIYAGTDPVLIGTEVITWNTGQISTLALNTGFIIDAFGDGDGTVTAGLLNGAGYDVDYAFPGNECIPTPLATLPLLYAYDLPEFSPSTRTTSNCETPKSCDATVAASATATAPGLGASVIGTAVRTGTVHLSIASGTLACPTVPTATRPIADLTDTGFKRLTVTASLPLAVATSAEQVCFNSTVPFKGQTHSVARAGTDLLLNCTDVVNTPPCVQSSKQVGTDIVVTFIVRGGDPRFSIVEPKGRQLWASLFPPATKGHTWSAHLESSGGKAPVSWKVVSGKLPTGCTLNGSTGAITGTPTATGKFSAVVQATDSEKQPQTARITIPIAVN